MCLLQKALTKFAFCEREYIFSPGKRYSRDKTQENIFEGEREQWQSQIALMFLRHVRQ